MSKELTINLDDELYTDLIKSVGEKNVNRFIESVVRLYLKTDSTQIYDVKLPVADQNRGFKIHSPRLADRTLADQFEMEIIEETGNDKL